ncbi:PEP-CTERM sorting domain-containing protein [Botrimarina mediterranea]|uniref:PEP-CTERM protein-sorting domain-containing protein n=1 Tax=Botrimarina mediterranea TaxID=2528022 RepID=A0A518K9M5_9BACT|nr:PEP-CTERM sorting domain-containing protein [Botrimarina mediterranea]QDV74494.1 hypothetical protein Spa11_26980 [Botrimarina mediterranea]QDV79134.1 hypothetical protein K2D_27450 [Planctomycetes bacterium K2D]
MKCSTLAILASAFLLGGVLISDVEAQVYLTATDDANTSNDTSRGPSTTNDRGDFLEIRNFANDASGSTTRKKVGVFKYDISSIDTRLFPFATLTGTFANGRDGNGTFNVYGLNDGEQNLDNVPDGSVGEANWSESSLRYEHGLGFDPTVATTAAGDLGIDLTEVMLLGTITLIDGEPLQSNTTDLNLDAFLDADTNGVVSFFLADERVNEETGLPIGTEWRLTAREASAENSLRLAFTPIPGDTDLSGVVDLADLDPIRTNYSLGGLAYTDGDLNGDGDVTFADFRLWKTGFLDAGGSLEGANLGFLSVPEPTSAALLMIAAAAFAGSRQRRV